MPEIAAVQVMTLLRQGNLAAAAHLAEAHNLPVSRAGYTWLSGNPSAALAILNPFLLELETKGWKDEQLKATVLQAIAHHARGERDSHAGAG